MKPLFSILLTLIPFILIAQEMKLPKKGICAHRGATENHPENTLPAFEEAIRLGAQMIEFDVQLSKDGALVIIHDDTVDRTTDGNGKVSHKNFKELRQLDAGSWKSIQFKNTRIPTLEEVLDIMPNTVWLNVHLKGGKELGKKVALQILKSNKERQSVIACSKEAFAGVQSVNKNLMVCNMDRTTSRDKYFSETIEGNFKFIQLKKSREKGSLEKELTSLKNKNVRVNYFGTDSIEEMKELIDLGVDFILTDRLSLLLSAFKKLETESDYH